MEILVLVIHVLAAAGVIGLVLLQHGKGADMGAAFGSGASGSLFGSSGSANFLSRSTAVLAGVFFVTSMALTYISSHKHVASSVMDAARVERTAPAGVATSAVPAATSGVTPAGDSRARDIPK
jgi:preprotein translocase subunit SecG